MKNRKDLWLISMAVTGSIIVFTCSILLYDIITRPNNQEHLIPRWHYLNASGEVRSNLDVDTLETYEEINSFDDWEPGNSIAFTNTSETENLEIDVIDFIKAWEEYKNHDKEIKKLWKQIYKLQRKPKEVLLNPEWSINPNYYAISYRAETKDSIFNKFMPDGGEWIKWDVGSKLIKWIKK